MPSALTQRLSDFKSLAATHVNSIRYAADQSWHHINLNQKEPDIIHDYFTGQNGGGISVLNHLISPPFLNEGFEVKFAGVFCHGQPVVTPMKGRAKARAHSKKAGDCELGDLHLVFVFLDQKKRIRHRRSILFQAKMRPKAGTVHRIDNLNQACLYESADAFDYVTMLTGQSRNLPIKHERDKALHYLFCGSHPVKTSSATAPALIDFGELLLRFMLDSEGLFFDARASKKSKHWSRINWDLLGEISKASALGIKRGLPNLLSYFNDFTDPTEFFIKGGEEGISTLFVIVKDRELAD